MINASSSLEIIDGVVMRCLVTPYLETFDIWKSGRFFIGWKGRFDYNSRYENDFCKLNR